MSEQNIIHATLVSVNDKGVLLMGKSGSGKSDLALRLIFNHNARLVADDMVCLAVENEKLIGSAPDNLRGLLEVRGVGIAYNEYLEKCSIELVVEMLDNLTDEERMPPKQTTSILGVEIRKTEIYAKQCSAAEKILVALSNKLAYIS